METYLSLASKAVAQSPAAAQLVSSLFIRSTDWLTKFMKSCSPEKKEEDVVDAKQDVPPKKDEVEPPKTGIPAMKKAFLMMGKYMHPGVSCDQEMAALADACEAAHERLVKAKAVPLGEALEATANAWIKVWNEHPEVDWKCKMKVCTQMLPGGAQEMFTKELDSVAVLFEKLDEKLKAKK